MLLSAMVARREVWAAPPGCLALEAYDARRYTRQVLRSFRGREAERIWRGEVGRKLPRDLQGIARRKLRMLNNSQSLSDLHIPPGNRLERLKGDRAGQYSIRINRQWRICFDWRDGDAFDVEIVDHH
jgi:proteic killer suppression protein